MENYVYPDRGSSLYPRHLNGMNILFVDSHVDWVSFSGVKTWCAGYSAYFYNY